MIKRLGLITGRGIVVTRGGCQVCDGVPAFFRCLSRKYSSIVVHCVEEKVWNVLVLIKNLRVPKK